MSADRDGTHLSPPSNDRTSLLLSRVLDELQPEEVSVGYIVLKLRRRSFGGLFILLAALALLPGISIFVGLAMLVPACQMMLGFRAPLLPYFIRRRRIGVEAVRAVGQRALPWVERMETLVRPRWFVLTQHPIPTLAGITMIGLALVIMLPLPFSNFPPALSLAFLSLGFLERDGLMIMVGFVLAGIALAIGFFMAFFAWEATLLFFSRTIS